VNNFSIDSKVFNDVAVLYPNGYLNNIVGESLESKCNHHLDSGIRKIVLNFSNVEFINSIGISILLGIMDMMNDFKGSLCFSNMGSIQTETFEMLGLKKHMRIFDTEAEALRHLEGEG
jgi:stage II sporulation protein AA (anti-sigma F factor antagonist)